MNNEKLVNVDELNITLTDKQMSQLMLLILEELRAQTKQIKTMTESIDEQTRQEDLTRVFIREVLRGNPITDFLRAPKGDENADE